MPAPVYKVLAVFIPLQAALMLGFAWHASRPPASNDPQQHADHVVITKSRHTLSIYSRDKLLSSYSVALGRSSGSKQFAGDHKTPEGHYVVDGRNPHSRFHLALHLSYPNDADRERAASLKRPPGGDIEIHGLLPALGFLGSLQRSVDWTDGCIALTNDEIDQVYAIVPDGTPIDILP